MLALAARPSLNGFVRSLAAQAAAIVRPTGGALQVYGMARNTQDTAGATPITAVEQTFGRFTDTAGNGHHAIQPTGAARATYSRRINRLTSSQEFNNSASWNTISASWFFEPNNTPSPNGTAMKITSVVADTVMTQAVIANGPVIFTLVAKPGTFTPSPIIYNLTTASTIAGALITSGTLLSNGFYSLTLAPTTGYSNGDTLLFYPIAGDAVPVGQNFWLDTAQVSFTTTPQRYQRTGATATDYDTAGFPEYARFDGLDDFAASATGGGGSAGICIVWAGQLTGGAGSNRNIWSDRNGLSGFVARLENTNALSLYAGNGVAFVNATTAGGSAVVGEKYIGTLFDDGVNLSVQINNGTPVTIARPVVAAGTAQFTVGASNTAASDYLPANLFGLAYLRNTAGTPAQREVLKRYMAQLAGVTI